MKGKKGWLHHSIEHGLAAKGIKTKLASENKDAADFAQIILENAGFFGGIKQAEKKIAKARIVGAMSGGFSRSEAEATVKADLAKARGQYPYLLRARNTGFKYAITKKLKGMRKKR
jgi:hypothetical protein